MPTTLKQVLYTLWILLLWILVFAAYAGSFIGVIFGTAWLTSGHLGKTVFTVFVCGMLISAIVGLLFVMVRAAWRKAKEKIR
jgi:hypothetical protein